MRREKYRALNCRHKFRNDDTNHTRVNFFDRLDRQCVVLSGIHKIYSTIAQAPAQAVFRVRVKIIVAFA